VHQAGYKKYIRVAIGVVIIDRQVLICRRLDSAELGGLWEFPGGKIEPGESAAAAAVRELFEELAIDVRPIETFESILHEYAHARVELFPILCEHLAGEPAAVGCAEFKWVPIARLNDYAFPAGNDSLIAELIQRDRNNVINVE